MTTPTDKDTERRLGDAIHIPGDYQHRALTEGPPVQRYWHRAKVELTDWLYRPHPGDRVLDVGCGSGVVCDRLAQLGARAVGVDTNPEAIDYARRTFGRDGVEFIEGYVDALDLPDASFDGAICLEVIEHVYPPQVRKLLQDLRRLLRPHGRLLLTTPNYRGTWPLVEWLADRCASTATMAADQHVTRFHRRMLGEYLREAGFQVVQIRTYCTFAPFLAAASETLARRMDRLERQADLPFGNLLAAVAVNPGGTGR